jgi:sulfur-oxidizing protein SoxZ
MAAPMGRPRIAMPSSAKPGEVIEIRTLIAHPMENGHRRDASGAPIPRDIIRLFTASFEGAEIFRAEAHTAISANPYFAFPFRAERSGTFTFAWTNDAGTTVTATARLRVG